MSVWYIIAIIVGVVVLVPMPFYVQKFREWQLLKIARSPDVVRGKHAKARVAELRKAAAEKKNNILSATRRLIEYGQYDTDDRYVGEWFRKAGYDVTEVTHSNGFSKRWTIKLSVTEKEVAELIVK